MLQHCTRGSLARAAQALRLYSTSAAAESPVVSRDRTHAAKPQCQASDFLPRTASLATTRSVLRLSGLELLTFLQGLVTNDVSTLETRGAQPVHACILNAQGRFLHDLFLHRQPGAEPVLLADVDRDTAPDLVKLLNRYKLRAKVDVTDVSTDHSVWVRFGWNAEKHDSWPVDPRLGALGQRTIVEGGPPGPEAAPVIYGREYRLWRIEHGIAEGPFEIPAGEAVPLEYNLDALRGISYDKGCYVGQELIARTHWSGAVRKRLMPFALRHPGDVPLGAAIVAEGGGKRPAGTVRVLNAGSGRGLAVMRVPQAMAAAAGELPLHIKDAQHVQLQPWRPQWWPADWTAELPAA